MLSSAPPHLLQRQREGETNKQIAIPAKIAWQPHNTVSKPSLRKRNWQVKNAGNIAVWAANHEVKNPWVKITKLQCCCIGAPAHE